MDWGRRAELEDDLLRYAEEEKMTIAITVKVNDGVVLASDSATSLFFGPDLYNQYYNADKVFNLKKGYPIGALTWGAGNIGVSSISTAALSIRHRCKGGRRLWRSHQASSTTRNGSSS